MYAARNNSRRHADLRHNFQARKARSAPRAMTLLELVVSVALLAVIGVTITSIFNISSDATARTAANSEVQAAAGALRDTLSDQFAKMAPGLLILESPAPSSPRRESKNAPRFMRIRHDRLVFLAVGDDGEYQSFTDPTRGDPLVDPSRTTASSSQAIVYFGPGLPLTKSIAPLQPQPLADDTSLLSMTLTASEWVFLHRAILLMTDLDPNTDPSWMPPRLDQLLSAGMFGGATLYPPFLLGQMDAIYSQPGDTHLATARTIANLILQKPPATDLLTATPSIRSLWAPSHAPRSVSFNGNLGDFYTKSGANFIPHLADFRIEWTDGRPIGPNGPDGLPGTGDEPGAGQDVMRTRWFGLRPDPAFDVDNGFLNNLESGALLPNVAVRREDFVTDTTTDEAAVFGITSIAPGSQNQIEWTSSAGSGPDVAYRAIWRLDTWRYRPKALRFTYRIYDADNRLKHTTEIDLDEDGDSDPDGPGAARVGTRFGRQFSVVVPLP